MADGSLTLDLNEALTRKLEQGAATAGMTPEAFAGWLLEQQLFDYDDYEWAENPRLAEADFDPSEPTIPFEQVMLEFRAEAEKRLAALK